MNIKKILLIYYLTVLILTTIELKVKKQDTRFKPFYCQRLI